MYYRRGVAEFQDRDNLSPLFLLVIREEQLGRPICELRGLRHSALL